MALITRLVRRNGAYCFRMAVPKHLVPRVGRSEVKSMLRTPDIATAKMKARLLSNAFDRLFDMVTTMPELTTNEINERIKGYFQTALNKSLEHALMLPSDPMVDLDGEVDYLRKQATCCKIGRNKIRDVAKLTSAGVNRHPPRSPGL